jgi:hypothetical protein
MLLGLRRALARWLVPSDVPLLPASTNARGEASSEPDAAPDSGPPAAPTAAPKGRGPERAKSAAPAPSSELAAERKARLSAEAARDDAEAKRTKAVARARDEEVARKAAEKKASELAAAASKHESDLAAAREALEAAQRALNEAKAASPSARESPKATGSGDDRGDKHEKQGKRVRELEQRLAAAEAHAERSRRRAEDAERELATVEGKQAARIATLEAALRSRRERGDEAAPSAAAAAPVVEVHQARRPPPGRVGKSEVAEVWWSPGTDCLEAITKELARAKESIDICVFTLTDDRLASAVLAAHRRRVRVRLITDNDKSNDEGSDVRRLAQAGISVRVDRTEFHMHHKFAVFDGERALTGSYNWTRGAAERNEEHIVVTDDHRLVLELARGFDALWRKLAP